MVNSENYLRTLAAEAFLAAEPWVRYNPTEMLTDAVLATVLPAHRAMVLAEAADAIETLLDHYHQDLTLDTPADTAAYRAGRGAVMDAVTVVRRLAATTPADQDSPGATEQATAVPEPKSEPTPDLRTLAAGRIAARDHAEGLRDDDIPTLGDYDRADAALSVLPAHRAMVLAEAAKSLRTASQQHETNAKRWPYGIGRAEERARAAALGDWAEEFEEQAVTTATHAVESDEPERQRGVVEVTTYTAVARRAGDWWAISVPELKEIHTQTKLLEQVEAMARDAIALTLGIPADSFDVEVRPEVPTVKMADAVQRWMTLDLWQALGHDPAGLGARIAVDGWANVWGSLLSTLRGSAQRLEAALELADGNQRRYLDLLDRHQQQTEELARLNRAYTEICLLAGKRADHLVLQGEALDKVTAERDRLADALEDARAEVEETDRRFYRVCDERDNARARVAELEAAATEREQDDIERTERADG